MELSVKFSKSEFPKPNIQTKETKKKIINSLLREYNIVEGAKDNQLIQTFYPLLCESISRKNDIPLSAVKTVVEDFLRKAGNFKKFLNSCVIVWSHTPSRMLAKAKIYLHKAHKIFPVFDYKRAKVNLKVLHHFFALQGFWPKISTQIAIVIYITDLLDKSSCFSGRLIQKNLRALCDCSAYAFHRTRNIMKRKNVLLETF